MGQTSLSFSIEELIQLDNQVTESYNGIEGTLKNIRNSFDSLKSNIKGKQANDLIAQTEEKIVAINGKMNQSFNELDSFLRGQMNNYTGTYEGALAVLNNALAFIDSNFA